LVEKMRSADSSITSEHVGFAAMGWRWFVNGNERKRKKEEGDTSEGESERQS
jgi:hypothetical protein